MGIYVYSMRKPIKNVELGHTNGRDVYEIARLDFLIKCSNVNDSKTAKMQVRNCESRFERVPKYVVHGEKWTNGMDVYRWMGNKPWAYDTPGLPMYKVGVLDLPVLRIKPDPVVSMAFKYVPAGASFTMAKTLLERFNAEKIGASWVDDKFKKDVTNYTERDVFVMDEMGEFTVIRDGNLKAYRVNHLPDYFNEWTVRVDMTNGDRTNEFEAMFG